MKKYRYIQIDSASEDAKTEKIMKMILAVKSIYSLKGISAYCVERQQKLATIYNDEVGNYLRATRRGTILYLTLDDGTGRYGRRIKKEQYYKEGLHCLIEGDDNTFRSWHVRLDISYLSKNRVKKATDLTTEERTAILTQRLKLFQSPKL